MILGLVSTYMFSLLASITITIRWAWTSSITQWFSLQRMEPITGESLDNDIYHCEDDSNDSLTIII